MSKSDKDEAGTPGKDAPAEPARGGGRAADVASAEAYAKDGILGAPGSEVPGAKTPVTRDGSGDADPRPASQIEGEQLGAEADEAAREQNLSRETQDDAKAQEHAAKAQEQADKDQEPA